MKFIPPPTTISVCSFIKGVLSSLGVLGGFWNGRGPALAAGLYEFDQGLGVVLGVEFRGLGFRGLGFRVEGLGF